VHELIHAAETFFDNLAAVDWAALGVAILLLVARLAARATAWRSILAASYPERRVPWWGVCGSYVAGVGVNAIVPARGGDVLKLVLVKRRIADSSYATLAPTLLVETVFDAVVASVLLGWALSLGVFPGLHTLPHLPSIDWHWPLRHPRSATAIGLVWAIVLALLAVIGARRVRDFRAHIRQGFAIMRRPRLLFTGVISWQAASWVMRAASVYFFLRAFHVPATARNAALVLAVQSLSTLLPFTPGGVGTQQGFLVYVFRNTHIPETSLLSFSVGMYITVTVVNVALGFLAIAIMLRTVRWRQAVLPEKDKVYARGPRDAH
jgi:glycosyltransferase 2 family protein